MLSTCSTFRTAYSDEIEPMPRTFTYVRVSTTGQTTENQMQEIEAAGFHIEPRRIVTEAVSGSVAIAQRRGFTRLMDKLEAGDVLIVTKLDRLGRDAIDVSTTVGKLEELGVRVYCLVLGGVDLASSAGKMHSYALSKIKVRPSLPSEFNAGAGTLAPALSR